MTHDTEIRADTASAKTFYGRFPRRLRAFVIDMIIIVLLLLSTLFVVISTNSDQVGRIVGFTLIAVGLLYEPLLVSLTGSTVGHYLTNLRVVDDQTHGNVGFLKAVVRLLIKTVLGIYSFITMAMTSRHQAVHDLLTRSTVQIRDRSKWVPDEYVVERAELSSPTMPSRIRRTVIILVYLFAAFVIYVLIFALLTTNGFSERAIMPVALAWLVVSVLLIIQGWRGRLYGCRALGQGKITPNHANRTA